MTKNDPSECTANTSEGSSLFISVVEHPPGYLLSLSCLSNHLQMRWQVTPAATVTIKVIIISLIVLTSSRCRVSVGQQNDYIIPQNKTEPFKIHIATQICPSLFSSPIPPHQNPQIFYPHHLFFILILPKSKGGNII